MYLKSLELHGFKSFPNRTVLSFEPGATVIVGPNGSGKSNISDAMRWVLGELSSRNIRGTKMEDVIFGGTDDRRPMGFAEVTVVFENCEPNRLDSPFDEVSVTRRYYRTGESEYLINKEPKRLRDIYELFLNTGVGREGYSIIGQGKIAEIVSKKSDERRTIFEEAAGISRFRNRKEQSEKALKETEDNLARVNDILSELENRVGPLEKEAEKAKKCLAIYEEKKRTDVALWLYDTEKIRDDVTSADESYKLSVHEYEIIESALNDLNAQQDLLYNKSLSNKMLAEQLLQKIQDTTGKLYQLENAMNMAESEFLHSNERVSECELQIKAINAREEALLAEKTKFAAKTEELEKLYKALMDERLEYLAAQETLRAEIETLSKEREHASEDLIVEENCATDLRVRIDVLKNSKVSDTTKSADILAEIAKYESEGAALKAEVEKCEKETANFKAKIDVQDEIIGEFKTYEVSYSEKKEAIQNDVNGKKVERDTLLQRADTLSRMAEQFEGYGDPVKFVMREYTAGHIANAGKIYGPISSLISVEQKYIIAIETALGASLQNIVVDNETTAKAAMYALKNAGAGRATFYPISSMRSAKENDDIRSASKMTGYVGRGDTLVKSDEKIRGIVEYLLVRTCVFDNIENASAAAKSLGYTVKMVTLDGQVINAGGSYTGGSQKRESGILSRNSEISRLKENAEKLEQSIQSLSKELLALERTYAQRKQTAMEADREKNTLLTLAQTQFGELESANAKYNVNRNTVEKLKYDYKNLEGQTTEADEELRSLAAEFDATSERSAALRTVIENRSAVIIEKTEEAEKLSEKAGDTFIRATEARKDAENAQSLLQSFLDQISSCENEKQMQKDRIEELCNGRETISEKRAENRNLREELEKQLQELTKERDETQSDTDEFDKELNEISNKMRVKSDSREVVHESMIRNENKLAVLRERQERLGSQLWEDYSLTYEDAVALDYPPATAENHGELVELQTSCKNRLRAYGNYNPGAIEEYAEVKVRYDNLSAQVGDLSKSAEDLREIIANVEVEMRDSFSKAFYDINHHFGETFRELFGGGSAELCLTNPDDVLTTGIEIKAAPPGKIIKNMSLLSGGEQSFVAIALLFAILKVNPTPFCILDEIEAALDEVNVYRFGEYIKKLDDGTQFILITHRRGTMEIGDRLYGVTMPQRGISQVIEVDVNEIEGKQKELLDGVL